MATKTNAMRLLDKNKISYQVHEYPCKEAIDGLEVAKKLDEDPSCVFKTLVTVAPSKNHYVFCIPANQELDLKKCARVVSEKSIAMIHVKELLPLTGYIRGGCSPFGMKKEFATIVDERIRQTERVYVSGGKLGLQIELLPNDLIQASKALVADVCKED
ncbi:MAG: Cys-tRNA(Pro) deacylase [Erysipelotrichaceae bacterium]|nr:Cys-tRNA(Pro) deacylase [Erysipelotrichaceae bacterium]